MNQTLPKNGSAQGWASLRAAQVDTSCVGYFDTPKVKMVVEV